MAAPGVAQMVHAKKQMVYGLGPVLLLLGSTIAAGTCRCDEELVGAGLVKLLEVAPLLGPLKTDDMAAANSNAGDSTVHFEAGVPTLVRAQQDPAPGLLYFPATLQSFGGTGQVLLSETTMGDCPQGHGWAGRNFVSARNGTGEWVELTPPNVNRYALRPGQWMVRPCVLLPGSPTPDWICMNYVLRRAASMSNTSGELIGTVFRARESGVEVLPQAQTVTVDFGTAGRAPKLQTDGSSFRLSTGGNILPVKGGYLLPLFGNTCPVGNAGCFVKNGQADYNDYELWMMFSADALHWNPR